MHTLYHTFHQEPSTRWVYTCAVRNLVPISNVQVQCLTFDAGYEALWGGTASGFVVCLDAPRLQRHISYPAHLPTARGATVDEVTLHCTCCITPAHAAPGMPRHPQPCRLHRQRWQGQRGLPLPRGPASMGIHRPSQGLCRGNQPTTNQHVRRKPTPALPSTLPIQAARSLQAVPLGASPPSACTRVDPWAPLGTTGQTW